MTCRDHVGATLLSNAIFSSPFEGRDIGLDRIAILRSAHEARKGLFASSMSVGGSSEEQTVKSKNTNDSSGASLFLQLPPEILRQIWAYMDIPMLGSVAQVHQGILKEHASGDTTWGSLVQKRFLINPKTKRPKPHGGKDWKDAYRTMHSCHRIPKCRWTNRKIVFAKQQQQQQQHHHPYHKMNAGTDSMDNAPSVSIWVLLNHREDCKTRVLPPLQDSNINNDLQPTTTSSRYLDFWVCLQNTRSSGASVTVDVMKAQLQLLSHQRNAYTEPCLQEPLADGYQWIMPRLIYKHCPDGNTITEDVAWEDVTDGVQLKPFEFCIVSIPFDCGQDVFETDFLARTWAMKIPYDVAKDNTSLASTDLYDDSMDVSETTTTMMNSNERMDEMGSVPANEKPLAMAWFVSEQEIWNNYCELPGGCLTLSNRDRRMHL